MYHVLPASSTALSSFLQERRKPRHIMHLGYSFQEGKQVKRFDSQVVIKRLGYLLDKLGIGTEIVEELRALRTAAVSPLDTEVPNEGKISTKWSIRQNVDIETIINAINN